jgi:periplasmic divalent cation tolerance protein
MSDYILVLSTVPYEQKGWEIARTLVQERLAACVTVSATSRSFYWWEDSISEEKECVLFIKTKSALYSQLEARLKEIHPYTVPEIIAFPVVHGSESYLKWMSKETR